MTPAFEALQKALKKLPGVGYRSAERMAIRLVLEKPDVGLALSDALERARDQVKRCERCGNIAEETLCAICEDVERAASREICVVEHVSDVLAIEKSGAFRGAYHVLHGKLSPINGVGPDELNLAELLSRASSGDCDELILALSNDIEGEATCHYITDQVAENDVKVSRIGFGLPSGGAVVYADSVTLKSALDARKQF